MNEVKVEISRQSFGSNNQIELKFNYIWKILKNFFSLFNIILFIITSYNFYQYLTQDNNIVNLISILIVLIMIFISGTIGFAQEYNNYLTRKKIISSNKKLVKVIRNTDFKMSELDESNINIISRQTMDIDFEDLVIGDFIYLTVGDLVPADLRIVFEKNLSVSQSSLSGEAIPVDKGLNNTKDSLIEYQNICYAGTSVETGYAIAVVIGVGKNTYQFKINNKVLDKKTQSVFKKCLNKISFFVVSFMICIIPIVLAVMKITGNTWADAILFSTSIAVGITPEMLPIIVTLNLANGYKKLSKKYNINIKSLDSVQAIGAIDVICMDKTGTITEGHISLEKAVNIDDEVNENLNLYAYINAFYQSGFRNVIDTAIIKKLDIYNSIDDNVRVLNEKPFDFDRKLLTVLINYEEENIQITKGAPEEILAASTKIIIDNEVVELTENHKNIIKNKIKKFNENGYRIVCLSEKKEVTTIEETDLTFVGFLVFFDKPKKETKNFIDNLNKRKVEYKILTGDSEIITRQVCSLSGIKIKGLVSGKELESLGDDDFNNLVNDSNVFVKLNPLLKAKIINALKEKGKIVGFIGDGINDVAALSSSDVGISFRDAMEPARQAADIIIGDDNLSDFSEYITIGRKVVCNMLKYINITIASNIGNSLSVLIAILWLGFAPMQPIQILVQNLLFDITQFALIYDRVDKSFLDNPRNIKVKKIIFFGFINGPVSTIFDLLCFLILSRIFSYDNLNSPEAITMFNSSWFILGVFTQCLVIFVYRSNELIPIKNKPVWQLWSVILFVMVFTSIISFTPEIAPLFNMHQLDTTYIGYLAMLCFGYVIFASLVKYLYIKKIAPQI